MSSCLKLNIATIVAHQELLIVFILIVVLILTASHHLLCFCEWVVTFVTSCVACADAICCAAQFLTVATTAGLLASFALCSAAATDDIHQQWWSWWSLVDTWRCYAIFDFPTIFCDGDIWRTNFVRCFPKQHL